MHIMPAYFTTTKMNRRKSKKKTQKQLKAEADHEKFLKKLGYKPSDQYPTLEVRHKHTVLETKHLPATSDSIPGHMAKKEPMQYSGERELLGIATMHKSNMVPVFADNKQVAIDIARMRR